MKIVAVVGNPKPRSRTLGVATTVAQTLADGLGGGPTAPTISVIELADHAAEMFSWESAPLGTLTDQVAGSDLVVFASPTYKGAYTGLLKAFLDRYPSDGLHGVVAVPVMTGAAAVHALAVEVHLRPLLVDLGATVPTRGLYVLESQLGDLEPVVQAWSVQADPLIRRALGVGDAAPGNDP